MVAELPQHINPSYPTSASTSWATEEHWAQVREEKKKRKEEEFGCDVSLDIRKFWMWGLCFGCQASPASLGGYAPPLSYRKNPASYLTARSRPVFACQCQSQLTSSGSTGNFPLFLPLSASSIHNASGTPTSFRHTRPHLAVCDISLQPHSILIRNHSDDGRRVNRRAQQGAAGNGHEAPARPRRSTPG